MIAVQYQLTGTVCVCYGLLDIRSTCIFGCIILLCCATPHSTWDMYRQKRVWKNGLKNTATGKPSSMCEFPLRPALFRVGNNMRFYLRTSMLGFSRTTTGRQIDRSVVLSELLTVEQAVRHIKRRTRFKPINALVEEDIMYTTGILEKSTPLVCNLIFRVFISVFHRLLCAVVLGLLLARFFFFCLFSFACRSVFYTLQAVQVQYSSQL